MEYITGAQLVDSPSVISNMHTSTSVRTVWQYYVLRYYMIHFRPQKANNVRCSHGTTFNYYYYK